MLALQLIDLAVVLLALGAAAGLAVYHFWSAQDTSGWLFARGQIGWLPLGLSLAAAMVGAAGMASVPGEAYYVGARWFVAPLASLLAAGLAAWLVVPYFSRLAVLTPYEYLEQRYDPTVRAVAGALFLAWRGVWLIGLLCLPCRVLAIAGIDLPVWLLVLLVGTAGTLLAAAGGLKAAVWQDVGVFALLVGGLTILLLILAGDQPRDQPGGLWQATREAGDFGRTAILDGRFDPADPWSAWTAILTLPFFAGVFFIADHWPAQRWLAAASEREAQGGMIVGSLAGGGALAALVVVGIGLLIYYDRHPEMLRPLWVANVEKVTRESVRDAETGLPLLDPRRDVFDAESASEHVAAGRVLQPNSLEPYTSADELLDPLTGEIDPRKLLARRPAVGGRKRPEIVLHMDAEPELLPQFVRRVVPAGLRGIVVAALVGLMLSAFQTGVLAASGVLLLEGHRRAGVGRAWLAARLEKPPEELTEADELELARPLVAVVGGGATVCSLSLSAFDDLPSGLAALGPCVGGPLLAVILLGLVTRHVTGLAALTGLAIGIPASLWAAFGPLAADAGHVWLWPFGPLAANWGLVAGFVLTGGIAWILGWFLGHRRPDRELRGLVLGHGEPGDREVHLPEKIVLPPDK